jgi:hypothetical protein
MEHMPDDSNRIALFYGPVLLAADLDSLQGNAFAEEGIVPALVPGHLPLNQWLKPTGDPLTFMTSVARPQQMKLIPFFRKKAGPYTVYWQILSGSEWSQREEARHQKILMAEELDLKTIDKVDAGDRDAEQKHGLAGTSYTGCGNTGILMNQCWRVSSGDAFGYELAVVDSVQNTLFCKFMGRDSYEKWHCRITIDGATVESLNRSKDDSYTVSPWEATYAIPATLIKGKKVVRVMFEKLDDQNIDMPRLMEVRILKAG